MPKPTNHDMRKSNVLFDLHSYRLWQWEIHFIFFLFGKLMLGIRRDVKQMTQKAFFAIACPKAKLDIIFRRSMVWYGRRFRKCAAITKCKKVCCELNYPLTTHQSLLSIKLVVPNVYFRSTGHICAHTYII